MIVKIAEKLPADFAALLLIYQPSRIEKTLAKEYDKSVFDGCSVRLPKNADMTRADFEDGFLTITGIVKSAERTSVSPGMVPCIVCK